MGDDGGGHDGVGLPGHGPVAPRERLDHRLHPGRPGIVDDLAEQLQRRGGQAVAEIDPGHVLDARKTLAGGGGHARHQTVVELEGGAGQTGPVDGQIGPLPGADGARVHQVLQGLPAGQDAVAVRHRSAEGAEIGPVGLDGHHGPGPVVGGQDQSRGGEPRQ